MKQPFTMTHQPISATGPSSDRSAMFIVSRRVEAQAPLGAAWRGPKNDSSDVPLLTELGQSFGRRRCYKHGAPDGAFLLLRLARPFAIALLAAFAFWVQSSFAFSLLGPFNEEFESGGRPNALDYGFGSDVGAPKNLGEEYRWNTPTLYYAFDQNFNDYFGSNGVYAVDQAFAIMNSITNVDLYSPDLSEFPLDSSRVNAKAQVLQLFDVKSEVLHLL